jgi:hypothetical protein
MADPLELARRLCLAGHPRFPRSTTPCAEHISAAYTYWSLSQQRNADQLRALVKFAREHGWTED